MDLFCELCVLCVSYLFMSYVSPTCPHPDFLCVLPEPVFIPLHSPLFSRAGPTLNSVLPGFHSHVKMNSPPPKETPHASCEGHFPRRAQVILWVSLSAPHTLLSYPARYNAPHRGRSDLSSQSGILFPGPL